VLKVYQDWKIKRQSKIQLGLILDRFQFEVDKILTSQVPEAINRALEIYKDSKSFDQQKKERIKVCDIERDYLIHLIDSYEQFCDKEIYPIIYGVSKAIFTLVDIEILKETKIKFDNQIYQFRNNFHKSFEENLMQIEIYHDEITAKVHEVEQKNYSLYQQLKARILNICSRKREQILIVTKEFVEREELKINLDIEELFECEAQKNTLVNNNCLRLHEINDLNLLIRRAIENKTAYREHLRMRLNLRAAILSGNFEVIKALVPQKNNNLKVLEHPPRLLVHGISPIKADASGSWEYASLDFNDSLKAGLSAKEYVDLLVKILQEGIVASQRIHKSDYGVYSDPEHPAIYFFDANDEKVDVSSYGIIELVIDTSKIKMPIVQAPGTGYGATEYLIYTSRLKVDFGIRLTCCYRPAVYRQMDSLVRFHKDVEEELKKREISFTETPLFVRNKTEAYKILAERNLNHSTFYERGLW